MKNTTLWFWLLTFCFFTQVNFAQTLEKSYLFDFGPNDSTNGIVTENPDGNGNYWNNVIKTNPSIPVRDLVSSENIGSTINLEVIRDFSSNGIRNGGLLSPEASLLDEFAILSATQDYFYTTDMSVFKLTNLDGNKAYKFKVFCSRENTATRISKYTFSGANIVIGELQSSGSGIGVNGYDGNNNKTFTSDLVFPDENGEIKLTLEKVAGSFAYINCMKLEEYSEVSFVNISEIHISGNDITKCGQTSMISAELVPQNATVSDIKWSVDDESIAVIDSNGLLTPVKNGIVTVSADSTEPGSSVSGSTQIAISNQYSEMYMAGSAGENGADMSNAIPMAMITNKQNISAGRFQLFTSLNSGTFNFYTSKQSGTAIGGSLSEITEEGDPIDAGVTGTVRIILDMTNGTCEVLPISSLSIVGNNTLSNLDKDIQLEYKNGGVWSGIFDITSYADNGIPRISFRLNENADCQILRLRNQFDRKVMLKSQSDELGYEVEEIPLFIGSYSVELNLSDYTYQINSSCESVDENKVTYIGSSVCRGQGASNGQKGYAYKFAQTIETNGWNYSNVSIGGNNTTNALMRWDDNVPAECSKYVVYGLSLGNEGINRAADPEAVFTQFRDNMWELVTKAREAGKVPVVVNNYTRADFTETEYEYTKKINSVIHKWDVASVNVLGTVDDRYGRWASGYKADGYHPNEEGHEEMSYAFVPTLFDAIKAGKPQPEIPEGTYATQLGTANDNNMLSFQPDGTLHSFTVSFDFKTEGEGIIASISDGGIINVSPSGMVEFISSNGKITGTTIVNSNNWHKLTLTHYYALGKTFLYIDNYLEGSITEKLAAKIFYLSDKKAPENIVYKNWFIYRSGMNADEIQEFNSGSMLKSSLELFAPLNENTDNLAQSTNKVSVTKKDVAVNSLNDTKSLKVFPNPATEYLKLKAKVNIDSVSIAALNGRVMARFLGDKKKTLKIDLPNIAPGVYLLMVKTQNNSMYRKIVIQ